MINEYRNILTKSSFFLEGPYFRYIIKEVPISKFIQFADKYNVPLLSPSRVELGKSFLNHKQVTLSHPYIVEKRVKSEEDLQVFTKTLNTLETLFRDIEFKRLVETPVEIVVDGNHVIAFHGFKRTAFAHVLNLPTIPVAMETLDANLIELAKNLFSIYDDPNRIGLYQPINHPYFELCPVFHPEAEDKSNAITSALKQENLDKTTLIIDLGAHLGFYSRKIREAGYYNVVAIDCYDKMYEVQKYLYNMGFTHVLYFNCRFEEYIKNTSIPCILVALSVLHNNVKDGMDDPLIQQITPWIKQHVQVFIVEHWDNFDVNSTYFWKLKCGFTKDRVIYHDENRHRTTHMLTK